VRAVWSYWSKPFERDRRSTWCHEWHHWLAWGLSLAAAEQHYPDTWLYTDDQGARQLIDELELPFAHVSTCLNSLAGEDPEWWSLGKIAAYARQREPFAHLDTDVFLWNPLPPEVEAAGVFAQDPEPILLGTSCYRPFDLERAIGYPNGGWLPKEWLWYRKQSAQSGACCGIFGGQHIDFIRHYARTALRLTMDPRNRAGLEAMGGKAGHMILVEQYLLTACVEYHRNKSGSRFGDIDIRYMFDDIGDAYRPGRAEEIGFTHLASDAKRNARICHYLEMRVQQDLPEHFARTVEFMRRRQNRLPAESFWDTPDWLTAQL
jgi:hypothetical protein